MQSAFDVISQIKMSQYKTEEAKHVVNDRSKENTSVAHYMKSYDQTNTFRLNQVQGKNRRQCAAVLIADVK